MFFISMETFSVKGQYNGHPMQQRSNSILPCPQGPPLAQGPARSQNSENLQALQKAIETMEEKGMVT